MRRMERSRLGGTPDIASHRQLKHDGGASGSIPVGRRFGVVITVITVRVIV
jgi:hypothetical protein